MSQKSAPSVSQVLDETQQTAGQAVAGVQQKVGEVVEGAKQQTTSLLESRKEQVADTLYTVAHVLRQSGQQLREQEQAPVAGIADQAAQQAERGSGYLKQRNVSELLNETEQLGRTHPLAFTGGALILGMLGVRFLRSSRRAEEETAAPLQLPPASPSSSYPTGSVVEDGQDEADSMHVPSATGPTSYEPGSLDADAVLPLDTAAVEE